MKGVDKLLYYNYHKHDHKGNVRSLDVVTKLEDYCERALELGHNAIFTTNHGMQGDIFEATTLAHQYNLKLIVGCECYYVKDRHEKDRSNNHLVVIALNDSGVRQLNKILSIANEDGYYYKPRIDFELLIGLNANDFVVTTACIAGILKDEDLVKTLHKKFGDNFLLEVQNHNEDIQREYNNLCLKYNKKYGIKLIHGNDSHYIKPEDSKYRQLFLKAKDIIYDHENEFILDYPTYDEIVIRYKKQGVLSDEQIKQALDNTLIFNKAEEITMINQDIKLPSISNNPNKELKKIVARAWKETKKSIPKNRIEEYENAIKFEMNIIEKTNMEDYFIIDNKIAKLSQEKYGAKLTNTGRGSAPSFYINKLLGLTDLDRLDVPCTLFPTRFMSIERILGAKSLPDIDLNTSDNSKFIQATEELLGKENCAWMIAWKPLQESSGFRLYCKSIDMKIDDYDRIAKDLDSYRDDDLWRDIIEESKHFVGVVESISESPCSMLLYDKPIAEEVGIIKIKDKMCCLLDGYNCDKYKYLKNDYLTVTVWLLIKNVCDLAGIEIPTIKELENLIDDKVWDIYEQGLTCTINQADSDWATSLVKRYKPKSISDGSQFIAIIRPGCASLLEDFLDRKEYTTGVEELDNILKDSGHRLIYQESIMKYLIWLGISESESYDIIKKIAKKKFKEKELEELKAKLKAGWMKHVGREDGFDATWTVVEQAAKYSFNASHSLSYFYDSVYGAYLKSHYPLEYYSVAFNEYSDDIKRTEKLTKELEYFNIKIENIKFGYSNGSYNPDRKSNSIYKGIGSIKELGVKDGDELYTLAKENTYNNFLELIKDIKSKTTVNDGKLKVLIKLDFFREFGKSQRLLDLLELNNNLKGRSQIKKDQLSDLGLTESLIKRYSNKETAKLYKELDIEGLIKVVSDKIEDKDIKLKEKLQAELEYLGYVKTRIPSLEENLSFIMSLDEFKNKKSYTYYTTVYDLKTGEQIRYRVSDYRIFVDYPFKNGDVIKICDTHKSNKRKKVNDKWVILQDEFNNMLDWYEIY